MDWFKSSACRHLLSNRLEHGLYVNDGQFGREGVKHAPPIDCHGEETSCARWPRNTDLIATLAVVGTLRGGVTGPGPWIWRNDTKGHVKRSTPYTLALEELSLRGYILG